MSLRPIQRNIMSYCDSLLRQSCDFYCDKLRAGQSSYRISIQLMKNQPEERLATTSELNLASSLAGNNREEAWGMGYKTVKLCGCIQHPTS